MSLKWHSYIDEEPENNRQIIQVYKPEPDGHYCMGMRKYTCHCDHKQYIKLCEEQNAGPVSYDFWWIYAEDFPFPDKEEMPCP